MSNEDVGYLQTKIRDADDKIRVLEEKVKVISMSIERQQRELSILGKKENYDLEHIEKKVFLRLKELYKESNAEFQKEVSTKIGNISKHFSGQKEVVDATLEKCRRMVDEVINAAGTISKNNTMLNDMAYAIYSIKSYLDEHKVIDIHDFHSYMKKNKKHNLYKSGKTVG